MLANLFQKFDIEIVDLSFYFFKCLLLNQPMLKGIIKGFNVLSIWSCLDVGNVY